MNMRDDVQMLHITPQLALSETTAQLAFAARSFASALAQSQVPGNAVELLPKVLGYAERLQLTRAAIADGCQVSEATVSRWAAGRVKPRAIIAKIAIDVVRDLALQKACEYEKEAESPVFQTERAQ